jgi:hypothetical protein
LEFGAQRGGWKEAGRFERTSYTGSECTGRVVPGFNVKKGYKKNWEIEGAINE